MARGNEEQNRKYCSKENVYSSAEIKNFKEQVWDMCRREYDGVVWRDWQQAIIDKLDEQADSRTINWIVDYEGNSGKSFLAKHLVLNREVIIADGKKDNVFNQINRKLNEEKKLFDTVILDIPRSAEGYINYGVLEQIKNGLIYSGKYEGGTCVFPAPHIVVFANFSPDERQFCKYRDWETVPQSRSVSQSPGIVTGRLFPSHKVFPVTIS